MNIPFSVIWDLNFPDEESHLAEGILIKDVNLNIENWLISEESQIC